MKQTTEKRLGDVPGSKSQALLQAMVARLIRIEKACDRHFWVPLIALVLFTAALTYPSLVYRPLWFDELLEYYVTTLSSAGDVLRVLVTHPPTTDPPLHYLLSYLSVHVFGASEFGFRLPSFLAFLIAIGASFRFLQRRLGTAIALIAPVIVLSGGATYYATEGRPYAFVMAACATALLCWQTLASPGTKSSSRTDLLAAFGLAVSVAAGLLSHYYGLLLGVPVFIGEVCRLLAMRTIPWRKKIVSRTLIALAIGYSAGLAWLPFLKAAQAFRSHIWSVATIEAVPAAYATLLSGGWFVWLFAAVLILRITPTAQRYDGALIDDRKMPWHETAALIALALLPFFGYAIAKFTTGLFMPRYVVASTLGCGAVTALTIAQLSRTIRPYMLPVSLAFLAMVGFWGVRAARETRLTRSFLTGQLHGLAAVPGTLVIAEPQPFLQAYHYAEPELKKKLAFPLDPQALLRYTGSDGLVLEFISLRQFPSLGGSIVDYREFLKTHSRFWIFDNSGRDHTWLLPKLIGENANVRLVAAPHRDRMFVVETAGKQASN